ncbi:hypothetical protein BG004_006566 [Podila humilis]|nr:hypothetical protein BG004_006566 [Podila humilis]
MKVFAALPALALIASSAQAWCMNGRSEDAIDISALVDSCGSSVASGDVFVLYDEISGVYLGNGEKNWLTLSRNAPAGFFWQKSPSNNSIKYLKGTSGENCSVENRAWFGHSGRFVAATGCNGGGFLEFRKWDNGQCKASYGCYQVGLLTGDQPVNGAIANFGDSNGYVHLVGSNCEAKKYKWVVKKTKSSAGWKATYSTSEVVSC